MLIVMICTYSEIRAFNNVETDKQQTQQTTKRHIAGQVLDDNGEVLPGVTLSFKESNRLGVTDAEGKFYIELGDKEKTLVATFIGMKPQHINIAKRKWVNIVLQSDSKSLSDVVVTGYQTISKERVTGAFDVITPDKLKGKLQTDILQRMEGVAPGLVMMGKDDGYFIRGITTLQYGASGYRPLIVVDGMPYEGELSKINPSIIKNITVLKDAAAASIYGARAANGVIVITTITGAEAGRVNVSYDASVKFTPKSDYSYLNLLSSRELVDLQKDGFKFISGDYSQINPRRSYNPVLELLLKHRSNMITDSELESGLDVYRNLDNRKQLDDFYRRTGVQHQHNVSITGGNERNSYALTLNYTGDHPVSRYSSTEQYGFTMRDNVKFFKWLKADVSFTGTFTKNRGKSGMGSYDGFYSGYPSYYMLKDAAGNAQNIRMGKSEYEIERLKSIGLEDETYSPITNKDEESYDSKSNYYRVQLGLNVKIIDGLTFDVRYQSENNYYRDDNMYSKYSYKVRNMINDAAQYDDATKELTLNVPRGGQISNTRGDSPSYTLRGQLNFVKEFGKHYITAIAGGERRQVRETSTHTYYLGYDKNTLGYKPVDAIKMMDIQGTQALSGYYSWSMLDDNYMEDHEDRFVSFYANGSYAFDNRYDFTGSIRIDQSNLFGTDPKYQYRPLWSLGASWHLTNEPFMQGKLSWLDNLTFRLTYGISGNVPKEAGPFLTLKEAQYNPWVNDFYSEVKNPPNKSLRWEKTATWNFGIDFAVLNNRLWGSLDIYNKSTSDLLAYRTSDYTLGWEQTMLNYGSMYNRGFELAVGSNNIITKDFKWGTSFNISYNKNKLIDVDDTDATVFGYSNGRAKVKGYPMNSVFSYRYAGLSDTDGTPLYYTNGGKDIDKFVNSLDDLEYSGTIVPKFNGSLTNNFTYKNFELSFMFIYYGGHVMRSEAAMYLTSAPGSNVGREILNMWKKPGDEKNPDTTPAFTGTYLDYSEDQHPWYAANKHVVKADYIKLRDVSLTYNFSKQLISNIGLSSLAITLQAQNLWTWKANNKGLDPEAMGSWGYRWGRRTAPIPTTWTIGVSANF